MHVDINNGRRSWAPGLHRGAHGAETVLHCMTASRAQVGFVPGPNATEFKQLAWHAGEGAGEGFWGCPDQSMPYPAMHHMLLHPCRAPGAETCCGGPAASFTMRFRSFAAAPHGMLIMAYEARAPPAGPARPLPCCIYRHGSRGALPCGRRSLARERLLVLPWSPATRHNPAGPATWVTQGLAGLSAHAAGGRCGPSAGTAWTWRSATPCKVRRRQPRRQVG